jgi:hypothetical protein
MTHRLACLFAAGLLASLGLLLADDKKPATRFSEHLIADKYSYAYGVAAADLDGDGKIDLTSSDTTNNVLYWFQNDGKGGFKRHVIQKDEPGWFERHAIGDINGDKRPDVVVVKNLHGHVVWFENSGAPADGKPWKRHVISTDCKHAYDVALADFNGDGWLDVAVSTFAGNHFAWYENPGKAGFGKEWKKHLIADKLNETRTVSAGDINGDGRIDLLGTARLGNLVVWFENPGKPGKPWTQHVIDRDSLCPTHGHLVDMDGDGDLDVVMAIGMLAAPGKANTHQVVWYENVGKPGKGRAPGGSWKKHVIGPLDSAFEAVAGDLNGDGHLDVAATSWSARGRLVWFENSGDPRGKWTKHVLKDNWPRANQVILADLAGNKRLDIAATAERGANELRWWKNLGAAKR